MDDNYEYIMVENGYNTNYIDVLLIALFFKPSYLEHTFLNNQPKSAEYLYLQELIKQKFVLSLHNKTSITSNIVNEIRNYSFILGWKSFDEILQKQNIIDFYIFLAEKFDILPIEITEINKIKEENLDIIVKNLSKNLLHDLSKEFSKIIPNKELYIRLSLDELFKTDKITIHLRELLEKWFTDNNSHDLNDSTIMTQNNKCNIINNPIIIPVYINRQLTSSLTYINIKIDIPKKIKIYKSDTEITKYKFHSLICSTPDGLYYALIENNNKWYIYDNTKIPCFVEIKMDDIHIIDLIQTQCTVIFYCATH